jgi:hypothetical protein
MELTRAATWNTSRWGIARVDGNAAKVAGASTGSASDQSKATRVGASERRQRMSFNDPHDRDKNGRSLTADDPQDGIGKKKGSRR